MMTDKEIARRRLASQRLVGTPLASPSDVVAWLTAVQAQDYGAAKWAVGQRVLVCTDAAVESACDDATILRTHVLRPTWHFVAPADIRWLLALTAPRVKAASAYYYRRLELDEALTKRSNDTLAEALQGGRYLTRTELASVLERAGIAALDLRFTYLIMHAELDGVLCSGPRRGKQMTYALLDERAPQARVLERDEALAELTGRYFAGHGPATLKDYVWWSGLTVADARQGLALAQPRLERAVVDDETYWLAPSLSPAVEGDVPSARLLPNYDEFIVGYSDRSAAFDARQAPALDARGSILFNNIMVADGQVVGTWKRALARGAVNVSLSPFGPLSDRESDAFAGAVRRYGEFLGMAGVQP